MNQELVPVSKGFVTVVGATGQQEKAFFLKPLNFKLGKQVGIHRFLYLPNSPKPLLGRDLLERLEAEIVFKQGIMELKVKENQLIEILSLALMDPEWSATSTPEREEITNQVYPGVWATGIPGRAKHAIPIVVELKEGVSSVRQRQYPLRLEDRKGIEGPINNFLQHGLLVECESEYNTPILPVKKPDGTYRVQDLREVNKIVKDLHPVVANPYTLLSKLRDNQVWFTVLDLKDAFFCLPLAKKKKVKIYFHLNGKVLPLVGKPSLPGQCYPKVLRIVQQSLEIN